MEDMSEEEVMEGEGKEPPTSLRRAAGRGEGPMRSGLTARLTRMLQNLASPSS